MDSNGHDAKSLELSQLHDYASLQRWLNHYCDVSGYAGWHNYGPADYSLYSSNPLKMLVVGAESGGYEKSGEVGSHEYIQWIRDGWSTPRYSSVFVTIIREYVELLRNKLVMIPFDRSRFSACYGNVELLVEKMRGTIYMNARITSNGTGSSLEDKGPILRDVKQFAAYRRQFMQVLKPDVIICAGGSAKDSLFIEGGAFPRSALQRDPVFSVGNHVLVMTPHLSRPNVFGGYEALHERANQCAKMYIEKSSMNPQFVA